jgi:hypothetical protein
MSAVSAQNESKEVERDFLENDMPIPGQNYVCLSFVSPETCIADKKLWDFYKYMTSQDESLTNVTFNEFRENFDNYCLKNQESLQKNFSEQNNFATSVRGIKVRGVYDNVVEAKYRAKQLQRSDPHFNVFVGQVGFWLPWDPSPGDIPEQEYLNSQLNTLMKSYRENQANKDQLWAQHKDSVVKNAMATNVKAVNEEENTSEDSNAVEEKMSVMESEDPWMKQKMQK